MNAETMRMFEVEIEAVVNRYTKEADLTVNEAVAVLEISKSNILEAWHASHRKFKGGN